jgi:2-oxoglutarate ferredoxin oxidoreductase subunit beta
VDLKILLFNNEIYGLTKGQYSPTSRPGTKSKTSYTGSFETPMRPLTVALAAEATFVARAIDVDVQTLVTILQRAAAHQGTAFVEIYQNCKIFNDEVWAYATDRTMKSDHLLYLEHGKPMIFGKDRNRGIRLQGITPEVVTIGVDCGVDDLLIHDEHAEEPTLALMLSRMVNPNFPEVVGVLRSIRKPTFEEQVAKQMADAKAKKGPGQLAELFQADDLWTVEA